MANAVTAITLAAALLVVTLMSTARQVRQAFQLGLEATLSEMLLKYGTYVCFTLCDPTLD